MAVPDIARKGRAMDSLSVFDTRSATRIPLAQCPSTGGTMKFSEPAVIASRSIGDPGGIVGGDAVPDPASGTGSRCREPRPCGACVLSGRDHDLVRAERILIVERD